AQTDRRQPGVAADAEHVELERRRDIACRGREDALRTESALTRAQVEMTVVAKLMGNCGKFRRAVDVVPIGVVLLEIADRVSLAEAVNVERRLLILGGLCPNRPCRRSDGQKRHQRNGPSRDALFSCAHCVVPSLTLALSQALTRCRASSN